MCLRSGERHSCQYSEGGVEFKDMSNVSRRAMGAQTSAQPTSHASRTTYQTHKTRLRHGRVRGADEKARKGSELFSPLTNMSTRSPSQKV